MGSGEGEPARRGSAAAQPVVERRDPAAQDGDYPRSGPADLEQHLAVGSRAHIPEGADALEFMRDGDRKGVLLPWQKAAL